MNPKEFSLKNVITFNPINIFLIAIPCVCIWSCVYYFIIGENFKLTLALLFLGFGCATTYLVIKIISKDITVRFDSENLIIESKKGLKSYLKSDITGFYSYDYLNDSKALEKNIVNFKIIFKNKECLYILSEGNKIDAEIDLKKMLSTMQIELGFNKIKRKKNQNLYWYSKN